MAPPPPPPVSFLFVVNELVINFDKPGTQSIGMPKDDWHNYLPPSHSSQYETELPSEVMRFRDGRISRASASSASSHTRYSWARQGLLGAGGILGQPASGQAFLAQAYKQASVFSCNPHLPVIVTDEDALVHPTARFQALHFRHSRPGAVSLASYHFDDPPRVPPPDFVLGQGAPIKYVAGAGPSWIPGLVPATYANPYRASPSGGLAGELAVLLGLMAFHAARPADGLGPGRSVDEVFLGRPGESWGLWKDYQWRGTGPPPGYPASMQDTPRGFLVHVSLDPENPAGSTARHLEWLEWQMALVRG